MKKIILFVCGHNSGRSQMAEVYFNTHNTNPDYEALSAGTVIKGDGKINPKVVELLLSQGIDILNQPKKYIPKNIDFDILEKAEKVFTMGCMEGGCLVGDREVDYDFGLADPANPDTDIQKMWNDFEEKMGNILGVKK